jgi:hypothetical protein
MLHKTNGTVHSLTACSKDRPVLCQELSWTSHSHINNQQQSVQVQCIKPTARAGQSQYRKCRYGSIKTCCHYRKCNWSGAKWNSCTDVREQVLRWQPFPARVAVSERLQSHRPEWLQLKAPEIFNGMTGGKNYLVRWSKIIFWNVGIHIFRNGGGQKHLVRERKCHWGSKGSWRCYNIATCAWTGTHKVTSCPQSTETVQIT